MKDKIIYVDFSKNKRRKKNRNAAKSKIKLLLNLKYLKHKILNMLQSLTKHKKSTKNSKGGCSKKTF